MIYFCGDAPEHIREEDLWLPLVRERSGPNLSIAEIETQELMAVSYPVSSNRDYEAYDVYPRWGQWRLGSRIAVFTSEATIGLMQARPLVCRGENPGETYVYRLVNIEESCYQIFQKNKEMVQKWRSYPLIPGGDAVEAPSPYDSLPPTSDRYVKHLSLQEKAWAAPVLNPNIYMGLQLQWRGGYRDALDYVEFLRQERPDSDDVEMLMSQYEEAMGPGYQPIFLEGSAATSRYATRLRTYTSPGYVSFNGLNQAPEVPIMPLDNEDDYYDADAEDDDDDGFLGYDDDGEPMYE